MKGLSAIITTIVISAAINTFAATVPFQTTEIEGPTIPPGISDKLDKNRIVHHSWDINTFWKRTRAYNELIYKAARLYNIPNNLIRAVIMQESAGKSMEVGSHGEIGFMQIKYTTALSVDYPGAAWELYKPEHNIIIGAKLIRKQLERYGGSVPDAIAAYNQGSVFRWNKTERRILEGIKRRIAERYGKVTRLNGPYDEMLYGPYFNQRYVNEVIKWYNEFNRVIIRQ
jgi:soluble lytic murein transglycosylase-like protein